MYRVTYDTPTRPADLPDGAKVEQLPREFPLKLTTHLNRELTVYKESDGVNLTVKTTGAWSGEHIGSHLDADVARELAHAILDAIGDPVPDAPAPAPTVIRDGDGDHWVLNPRTGKWKLTYTRTELSDDQRASNVGETLDVIESEYGRYTVIK